MKKRNYLFIMLLSTFTATQYAYAQKDSSGIYKTADDFQQRKLSYAINYKTEKHIIKDDILFNNDEIKIIHNGQTYTLYKDSTYGFKNNKGEVFRFIDKKEYAVLNAGETLLIYMYQHPAHSAKETANYAPLYFFSVDAASAPQSLTKANLKAVYPDNHKFHDALDEQFKSDKELYTYDTFHKMYKLNWILKN